MLNEWMTTDAVHNTVLGALIAMSALAWVILLLKTWEHVLFALESRRLARLRERSAANWQVSKAPCYRVLWHFLQDNDMPAPERAESALAALTHQASWGMAGLSVIASSAPFIGLLGTVWGIYQALLDMGAKPVVGIAQVAGPIGQALIMTALGLAVAIPATIGYNLLVRANKNKQYHAQQLLRRWLLEQSKGAKA